MNILRMGKGEKPMSMTNWDKWKETLAAEDFASLLGAYCGEMPMGAACPYCPIKDFCNHTLYDDECKDAVLKWANSPAKEEEK
jgi:hypothetical protein